jgi:hypothetical protein
VEYQIGNDVIENFNGGTLLIENVSSLGANDIEFFS